MARPIDDGGERGSLAPVIPIFEASSTHPGDNCPHCSGADTWASTWDDDLYDVDDYDDEPEPDLLKPALERLIRRLRRRGLSIAEATDSLLADGVDRTAADVFVAELVDKRWLGDADLAEQLVHTALTRKSEGRRAIAQALAKRRIPRDVADAVLAVLPDDDADRALDYARRKAPAMAGVDREAAVRRLTGQLARRGYPGSVALDAARRALDEVGPR